MKEGLTCEQDLYADTSICSFTKREQPATVLKHSEQAVLRGNRTVVSAATWSEVSLAIRAAGPTTQQLSDAFCARLDAVLPLDRAAVDAPPEIKVALCLAGMPIGLNDTAIAGHPIAAGAVLVTANGGEF